MVKRPPPADVDQLQEVVLLGPHPKHPMLEILVLGTTGDDGTWASAVGLVDVALAQQRLPADEVGLMIVDAQHDVVRASKALRRRKR